ncbi:MAG: hypothetical protein HYS12_21320 [Planctomycetes bacterium]|nr:hypothetical protein [Planctomycetota bacterium]
MLNQDSSNVRLESRTYQSGRCVPTAKKDTHWPGLAPALGLRAGNDGFFIVPQTNLARRPTMFFSSWLPNRNRREARQPIRRVQPRLEVLEDRAVPATGYALVDLGGLAGLSVVESWAIRINEAGDIAGVSYTAGPKPNGDSRHPVVWHRDAGGQYQITDLGILVAPDVAAYATLQDMNNKGEAIGYAVTNLGSYEFLVRPEDTNNDGKPDRWFRDSNGDGFNDLMINLTKLRTGNDFGGMAGIFAINDHGQMIGSSALYQFDSNGNLVANPSVRGLDINNNGQIVDGAGNLWQVDAAGNLVSGPTDLGLNDSSTSSINAAGTAVAAGRQVWQSPGTVTNLGTLGGSNTNAHDINDAVQVVGQSPVRSNGNYHAFVWQAGVMTDLNSFLPRKSAWELSSAHSINNAGWIVGNGQVKVTKTSTELHGFLLIPNTSGSSLTAAAEPTGRASDTVLSSQQVQPLLAEAVNRWQSAGVDTAGLAQIDIRIANLGGTTLGLASGNTIWLDANAAGWGWFVAPRPVEQGRDTVGADVGEAEGHRPGARSARRENANALRHVTVPFPYLLT